MSRIGPTSGDVVVIRAGYRSDAEWWAAINAALSHGRDVQAIDAAGRSVRYPAADGLIDAPEVPEW